MTVLTSYDDADAAEAGYALPVAELVRPARRPGGGDRHRRHRLQRRRGAGRAGRGSGRTGLIVTPGIRPAGAEAGDQKRVMTPAAARAVGIDHVVVGRPITGAADPRAVAQAIVADLA